MKHMEQVGKGVVAPQQSLPNDGMAAELAAYAKADQHDGQQYFNKLDSKDRGIGAQILRKVWGPKHDAAQQFISRLGRRWLRTSIQEVLLLRVD